MVKDNNRDLKLGKITKIIKSNDDGEIRKVVLKIKNSEYIHPVTNLRLLECQSYDESIESNANKVINKTKVNNTNISKRPQRDASKIALRKIVQCIDV